VAEPRSLLERLARRLVDDPAAVSVSEHPENGGVVFELSVAPGDVGRVIGRDGRTVRALRTVLAAAGDVDRTRYSVEVLD
jgi:uncharacterized protein